MLEVGSEVTASSGTSVVLASGATAGDELNVYAFSTFNLADVYTKAQTDAFAVKLTGDQSIAGNKNFAGNTLYVDDTNDRVGIGTNSPLQKLDMNGTTARFSNGSYTGYLGAGSLLVSGGSADFTLRSDDVLSFGTGGPYERMRIDSSGRITKPAHPMASWTGGDPSNVTVLMGIQNSGTVFVNTGNHFNTSTRQFTCPVAGRYRVQMNGYTGYYGNYNYVTVRKNGSALGGVNLHFNKGSSQHIHVGHGVIVDCAANDTLDVYLTGTGGSNEKVDTWFVSVELIG
jgi:hypothetical protein